MTDKHSPQEASAGAFVAELEAKRPEGGRVAMREIVALATRYVEITPRRSKSSSSNPPTRRASARSARWESRRRESAPPRPESASSTSCTCGGPTRIDTWDLVEVSAHQVVGGHLADKNRDVLFRLARSDNWWERRIAMFATLHFIRRGELDDTFALAEILAEDEHQFVQTVTGGMLREAGKQDRARLLAFLDKTRRGCRGERSATRSKSSTPRARPLPELAARRVGRQRQVLAIVLALAIHRPARGGSRNARPVVG